MPDWGFQAFTGNDDSSLFVRKGRAACWTVLEKNEKFVSTSTTLGSDWNLAESVMEGLEEFVCPLYGRCQKEVNSVRNSLFKTKYLKQNNAICISLYPLTNHH